MKRLPAGISDFQKLITGDYYYIDKTFLIENVIKEGGDVTLYTRPRRFGKTLNMSMLKNFFEIGSEPSLFDGLKISEDREFCEQYQGQFPVISISLKGVDGRSFESAFLMFCSIIADEINRFDFLLDSDKLNDLEKENYRSLIGLADSKIILNSHNLAILSNSLYDLTALLHKHYAKPVAVFIDEYDVPLDKAHVNGYYNDMVELIRNMFHAALKDNRNLAFGVLTGCLRISKESIFTGMNNFKVNSITKESINETFGFTENEVDEMLSYYHLSDRKSEAKEWYDGYRFGKSEIYCPWDMVNYCHDLYTGDKNRAGSYWANSSSNSLVREFVGLSSESTKEELENLVNGGKIRKKIREELTYRDLDNTIENLWSVLYLTGYLTGYQDEDGMFVLWIPNREVREIYINDIEEWFTHKYAVQMKDSADAFYSAALDGDSTKMESVLCNLLFDSISIRDSYVRKSYRENFYHGFMLGLLTGFPGIQSNSESGNGYSDIQIRDKKNGVAVVMELKYSDSDSEEAMDSACKGALQQISDKRYIEEFTRNHVFIKVIPYGIAFNKKTARVQMGI